MTWFYESGGQQAGPVSEPELDELLRNGKINRGTLVWREGMADWQPLAQARPEISLANAATPAGKACVECGRIFPPDELVNLNKSWVCAQCKPVFLQRMAEGVPTSGGAGLWRQGKRLFTYSETAFPDRCVKCNAPANGFRLKRVLYWHHPAYYLLLFCNLLILLIVVLIVRKKAVLRVGLCEKHRKQRTLAIILCSIGMLVGFVAIIAGAVESSIWIAVTGTVFFLAGAIWGIAKGRTIAAARIDKNQVWVSGVCREFLDQLPERPG